MTYFNSKETRALGTPEKRWSDLNVDVIHLGNGFSSELVFNIEGRTVKIRFNTNTNVLEYTNDGQNWYTFDYLVDHDHDTLYYKKSEIYTKSEVESLTTFDSRYVLKEITGVLNSVYIGDNLNTTNKLIVANNGETFPPAIRYNSSTNEWEYRKSGTDVWYTFGLAEFDTDTHNTIHNNNITTLNKITESGNKPLWNGSTWPGDHEHLNKSLLDTYNQSNTDISDAVSKKHEHTNKSTLDKITESGGVPLWNGSVWPGSGTGGGDMYKSVYDTNNDGKVDSANNADSVPWSGITDRPTSSISAIDSAVTNSHTHTNKTALDLISIDSGNPLWNGAPWPGGITSVSWNDINDIPSSLTNINSTISNNSDVAANTLNRHNHNNKTDLDKIGSDGEGKPTWNGSAWDSALTTGFLKDDGSVSIKGSLIPNVAETYDLGSESLPFNNIYTKDLHVSAQSLYVNGKKVISDISNEMTFSTDPDQSMKIKTTGIGGLTLSTQNAILLLNSTNEINLNSIGGIELEVAPNQSSKHITLENLSNNGNISITAQGNNAQVQINAKDEIDLTAPLIDINGVLDVSGNFIWKGVQFPNISTDASFNNASDTNIPTQLATKTYISSVVNALELDQNITFETLNANGDVGINSDQLAVGNHDHSTMTIKPNVIELNNAAYIRYNNGSVNSNIFSIVDGNYSLGAVNRSLSILGNNLTYNGNTIYHAGNLDTSIFVQNNNPALTNDRTPVIHNNSKHSETYITTSSVTFETLNANGDVGTNLDQLARGNHSHDYVSIFGDNLIDGSLSITGDLSVSGNVYLPEMTVGNTLKLANKVPSITAAPDSVVLSDVTGVIDRNYLPEDIKNPSVYLKANNTTFKGNVELVSGNNISIDSNSFYNTITVSSFVDQWRSNKSYKKDELVVYNGKLYQAIVNHTSANSFGQDMVDGYIKWNLLSISNVVNNWNFDHYTVDQFLVSASPDNPYIVNAPLTEVTSIDTVDVEILKFIGDDGFEWPNIIFDVSSFTANEIDRYTIDDQMIMDGKLKMKKIYNYNMSNEGTLGTGNYFKVHIDTTIFKKIIKFEMVER